MDRDGSCVELVRRRRIGGVRAEPFPAYASAGTCTVTLTVTDDDGAPAMTANTVAVSAIS